MGVPAGSGDVILAAVQVALGAAGLASCFRTSADAEVADDIGVGDYGLDPAYALGFIYHVRERGVEGSIQLFYLRDGSFGVAVALPNGIPSREACEAYRDTM